MATDEWIEFGGVEFINLSRTAQLAETMGIDSLWTAPEEVQWIEDALDGEDYAYVNSAPWYDPDVPASAEFAGIVPLSIPALDDSTLESATIEYVTAGGSSNGTRNRTLVLVANVALVARTERGADFGKQWMNRVLAGGAIDTRKRCSGSTMRYFEYTPDEGLGDPPIKHRRDVSLTRGATITRKRSTSCASTWTSTFTLTANDPFEYGEEIVRFVNLGKATAQFVADNAASGVVESAGSLDLVEEDCPVYDYSPIFDPLFPALVAPPTVPDFYPAGWALVPGLNLTRYYAFIKPAEPSSLGMVPVLTLRATSPVRMVRVSVWPKATSVDDFCGAIWTAVLTYMPANLDIVIDGEQESSYAWDGFSPQVRRADSLVYGPTARPLEWDSILNGDGLLVTMDIVDEVDFPNGLGSLRASLSLVPKSD